MTDVNVTGPAIELILTDITFLQSQNYVIIALLLSILILWVSGRIWE